MQVATPFVFFDFFALKISTKLKLKYGMDGIIGAKSVDQAQDFRVTKDFYL